MPDWLAKMPSAFFRPTLSVEAQPINARVSAAQVINFFIWKAPLDKKRNRWDYLFAGRLVVSIWVYAFASNLFHLFKRIFENSVFLGLADQLPALREADSLD